MEKLVKFFDEKLETLRNKDEVETSLKKFRVDVNNFFLATDFDEKALDIHVESLLNLISTDVAEIHDHINNIIEDESWNDVLKELEKHPTIQNPFIYYYMFFNRIQCGSESFDDFYKDLKKIMSFCDFGNAAENLMKTQITIGINDEKTRYRLLTSNMDLDCMIMFCRAMELFAKKRKVQVSQSLNSSINVECEVNSEAACDEETLSVAEMNLCSRNLSENNLNEPEEYHLDHSILNHSDEHKWQNKEFALETNQPKWKNRFSPIETFSHETDNFNINKTLKGLSLIFHDLDAKDNSISEQYSPHCNENSIINTTAVNYNVNNDNNICKISIDNSLLVMYQDYKLLGDILDASYNNKSAHKKEKSSIATDSKKPLFILRNKIVDWLKSNNKGDILKHNQSFSCDQIDNESINSQLSTDNESDEPNITAKKLKSKMIVEEIISSEKAFIDVLILLCKTFFSFVEDIKEDIKIPPVELSNIFSPLPQILILSQSMLNNMELRMDNWNTEPKISDVIVNKGPFLNLYSTYIQHFKNKIHLLDKCCTKYPRFGKCVKDFEALDICNKLSIKHHMSAPIKRIPNYKLLLSRYLKSLDEKSIDYKNTIKALDIISGVGQKIEKSIESGDCVSKLLHVQSKLRNYVIVEPGRELIIEGELYKLSRNQIHIRYFILLNDCLLYAHNHGIVTGIKVKSKHSLKGMKVLSKNEYEFNVITTTRSFSLRAQSTSECEKWVSSLETSIRKFNMRKRCSTFTNRKSCLMFNSFQHLQLGFTAPVWIQDYTVTKCQLCPKRFSFFTRKHHCRACGKVVCAKCSANKAPLYYKNFSPVRVCDECYEISQREFNDKMQSILETAFKNSDFDEINKFNSIKNKFKSKKEENHLEPSTSQINPNGMSSQINDWLYQWSKPKKWNKFWFVLREYSLYVYNAPEDIAPIYKMDNFDNYSLNTFIKNTKFEKYDSNCVFQLSSYTEKGMIPMIIRAENSVIANKWISVLREKTNTSLE